MGKHRRPETALERERRRRQNVAAYAADSAGQTVAGTRREAAAHCAWCQGEVDVKATGRIPKWCSASCRQRAWEQRRAVASGRAAVEVVERVVRVSVERMRMPRHDEWLAVLAELTSQLDSGQIYTRDLQEIGNALASVLVAYRARPR